VRARFVTPSLPSELPLHECSCGFCRRHGARTTRDPQGTVRLTVGDSRLLSRYNFGHTTCDFLVCARCGVYVAAVFEDGGRQYATVNTRTFENAAALTATPRHVTYDSETPEARMTRRRQSWTPVLP
jgi:hypothetical protein